MTIKQIDSVVGIDRMDTIDRQKLDPRVKFKLLCEEMKEKLGEDPRHGGFCFVARPRVMLQVLIDLKVGPFTSWDVMLEKAIIIGAEGADVVCTWERVPLVVRCNVSNDQLYCVRLSQLPSSKPIDRQRAGQLRIAAHAGRLESLRD